MIVCLPVLNLTFLQATEILCSYTVGIRIGFVQTQYTTSESDGSVEVRVAVLDGEIQGVSVVVTLSTMDGSALGQYSFSVNISKAPFIRGAHTFSHMHSFSRLWVNFESTVTI